MPKAFIIAAVSSGTGKTTIALGLMAALKKRGLSVQPFKTGPDYIDPGYHSAVSGRPSYNLDTWMMGIEGVKKSFTRAMSGADVGVIEGVMGLFDGKNGTDENGSTAHLAKVLELDVILIVDAKSMARSAAAIVCGFEKFDEDVKLSGIIFNRVGSERHFEILKEAVENSSSVKVLGYLPREEEIKLQERHLGLITHPETIAKNKGFNQEKLVELIEKYINIEKILQGQGNITSIPPSVVESRLGGEGAGRSPRIRIAVAYDTAFCFYYRENLDILKEFGAELIFFSPLKDKKLPDKTAAIYMGGGYPELHAASLEANTKLKDEIKDFAEKGMPVYAECGGLMYLGKRLINIEEKTFDMLGIFPWTSRMLVKRKSLGYREVTGADNCPFLRKGEKIRGHEFHYSEITPPDNISRSYLISGKSDDEIREGYLYKNTLASYVHLHFASNRKFAENFVNLPRN